MGTYNDCKLSKYITELPVERFYINDIPVCMSWYGDDEHKQEACLFLQFRKFGLVSHCAYLGKDCNEGSETVNRVLDDCPLHNLQAKLKDPDNVFVKVNLDGTEEVVENPYKETSDGN